MNAALGLILAALLQAAPESAPPPAPTEPVKPADISQAVDANGVPAWAKRKRLTPVQACETKPNVGVETWRQRYDGADKTRPRLKPPTKTCR